MSKSAELYERAIKFLPAGVNSPVRAFRAVGGMPRFIRQGKGCRIVDEDGNEFIDYVCSWGPLILGHAHPEVVEAAKEAIERGSSFGAPTEAEVRLAEAINEAFPTMELLRLVNSGTEGVMSAIRVARGFTGRQKVIKFDGCYHGHADSLLVQAGSGATTFGVPDSAGVPQDFTKHSVSLRYNDAEGFTDVMNQIASEVACVIVEPVAGNMGVVPPKWDFLVALRSLCSKYDVVLIFDEVITGFRIAYGGAQAFYGIQADMTCLGKILGGGFPIGAYGGRKEIMEKVAPLGPVYQAGTLSGNPVAVTAGLKTLDVLRETRPYGELERKAKNLEEGLLSAARKHNLAVQLNRVASMMTLFFTETSVVDYETAKTSDTQRYAQFFHAMLKRGIYLPPSQFEAMFVSTAHTDEDIERTVAAAEESFAELTSAGER